MSKKRLKVRRAKPAPTANELQNEAQGLVRQLIATNAILTRSQLIGASIDPRRDINAECGYPDEISTQDYQKMYDREGIATKVVSVWPDESWVVDPTIEENNSPEESVFEKTWIKLEDQLQIYSIMNRADEISGIGRFGIILLGFDDGKSLDKKLEGINDDGTATGSAKHELLYLRTFSENAVTIKSTEDNVSNPRFGLPTLYSIKFQDPTSDSQKTGTDSTATVGKQVNVHWTRIIHIADNKKSSEVFGVPRMQILFNRLYDIRKIAGGSGEMFWKGGFPGISFELDANAKALTPTQLSALKTEIANYANGLQRYLTTQGVNANSLMPQVADPKNHVDVMITIISIALGIPKRIFQGSEAAKLASNQDTKNWNKRVAKRQNKYISPSIIKPLIDRLVAAGALPQPGEDGYQIWWPDLDTPSNLDKADVTSKYTEAFAKYVSGGVDEFIPPEIYLEMFTDLSQEEIKKISDAIKKRINDMDGEDERIRQEAEEEEAERIAAENNTEENDEEESEE